MAIFPENSHDTKSSPFVCIAVRTSQKMKYFRNHYDAARNQLLQFHRPQNLAKSFLKSIHVDSALALLKHNLQVSRAGVSEILIGKAKET